MQGAGQNQRQQRHGDHGVRRCAEVSIERHEAAIGPEKLKPAQLTTERASINNPGDFLLSHAVTRAVPSAPAGLTSVFGMGTGVTLPTKSPENFSKDELCT